MKIQSWVLAGTLLASAASAGAQEQLPVARAEAAKEAAIKRAESLSEEQINQSHDIPALTRLAQVYNEKGDMQRFIWTLHRVAELMPDSGDLKLQLAMAYAKVDDKQNAYDTLVRMQTQGFGYDIANDSRFEPIHGTKVWDYIVTNLQVNSKPFGEGKPAFSLPQGDYLFNALAWDPGRNQFLLGGAREGNIRLVDRNGKISDFIKANDSNGLWGIDALALDAAHKKLYVTSSATVIYKGFNADNAGQCGLFEFDLASGKLLRKYTFPASDGIHKLNAVVVDKDGHVYAADGARKQVFKLESGALKQILDNPKLTKITALALSADGRTLYLADFAYGIFGFDLAKGEAFELRHDPGHLVLGGITGMYWYDGTLAVIEDAMVPKRVMRLKISADDRSVASTMPLDAAQPSFSDIGSGAVAGDKLYFLANRQDALYDERGVLTASDKLAPVTVFASNLRFAWDQKGVSTGMAPLGVGAPPKAAQTAPDPKP